MADDQGELRAAASKAEARLDALEQAVFKERDELKAKVAELSKTEERLRYQILHLSRALDARAGAARRAVELAASAASASESSSSSSTANGSNTEAATLREKLASVLLGKYYLSEEDKEKKETKS